MELINNVWSLNLDEECAMINLIGLNEEVPE
jgi:hypothetical protein